MALSATAPIIDFSRESDFDFLPLFLQKQLTHYGEIDTQLIIIITILSMLFFGLIYILSHILATILSQTYRDYSKVQDKRKRSALRAEFNNRVVSTINAIVGVLYATWAISSTPELAANPNFGYTKFCHLANAFFLGYFIQDTYFTIRYARNLSNVTATILHHICSITASGNCCFSKTLHYWSVRFLFTELSTPFLNLRWYLDQFQMKQSLIYKLNGILITLTFFYCRILFIFDFPFTQLKHLNELIALPTPLKQWLLYWQLPTSFAAHLLNTWWFYLISKGLLKTLSGKSTRVPREKRID